jgi:hypothetical protein
MLTSFVRQHILSKVVDNLFIMLTQFATRAVRVVDLITNLDMAAFQTQGGLQAFINRLEVGILKSGSLVKHKINILQYRK